MHRRVLIIVRSAGANPREPGPAANGRPLHSSRRGTSTAQRAYPRERRVVTRTDSVFALVSPSTLSVTVSVTL